MATLKFKAYVPPSAVTKRNTLPAQSKPALLVTPSQTQRAERRIPHTQDNHYMFNTDSVFHAEDFLLAPANLNPFSSVDMLIDQTEISDSRQEYPIDSKEHPPAGSFLIEQRQLSVGNHRRDVCPRDLDGFVPFSAPTVGLRAGGCAADVVETMYANGQTGADPEAAGSRNSRSPDDDAPSTKCQELICSVPVPGAIDPNVDQAEVSTASLLTRERLDDDVDYNTDGNFDHESHRSHSCDLKTQRSDDSARVSEHHPRFTDTPTRAAGPEPVSRPQHRTISAEAPAKMAVTCPKRHHDQAGNQCRRSPLSRSSEDSSDHTSSPSLRRSRRVRRRLTKEPDTCNDDESYQPTKRKQFSNKEGHTLSRLRSRGASGISKPPFHETRSAGTPHIGIKKHLRAIIEAHGDDSSPLQFALFLMQVSQSIIEAQSTQDVSRTSPALLSPKRSPPTELEPTADMSNLSDEEGSTDDGLHVNESGRSSALRSLNRERGQGGRRRLSRLEEKRLKVYMKEGKKKSWVARKMRLSRDMLDRHWGVMSPSPATAHGATKGHTGTSSMVDRLDTTRAKWTPEEDKRVRSMKGQGYSWEQIHKILPHRTPGAIQVRYSTKLKA